MKNKLLNNRNWIIAQRKEKSIETGHSSRSSSSFRTVPKDKTKITHIISVNNIKKKQIMNHCLVNTDDKIKLVILYNYQ